MAAHTPVYTCSTRVSIATILQIWHNQRLLRVLDPVLGLHEEADSLCASGRACIQCMLFCPHSCSWPHKPPVLHYRPMTGTQGCCRDQANQACTSPAPFPGEGERGTEAPAVAAAIKGGSTAVLGGGVWAPQRPGQRIFSQPAQAGKGTGAEATQLCGIRRRPLSCCGCGCCGADRHSTSARSGPLAPKHNYS